MNIRIFYLYRDAGNNKQRGEVIFANPNDLEPEQVEARIRDLLDGDHFVAEQVGLPTLYFSGYDDDLDHGYHEFDGVDISVREPTDSRTIDEFLAEFEKASEDGWKIVRNGSDSLPEHQERVLQAVKDPDKVVIIVPADAWNLLSETLVLDADSSCIEPALRKDIRAALGRIEHVTPPIETK